MATSDQIEAFTAFARQLFLKEGGEQVSLDDIYDQWCQRRNRNDDLRAIREAHAQYESDERGRPAEVVLAEFRASVGGTDGQRTVRAQKNVSRTSGGAGA